MSSEFNNTSTLIVDLIMLAMLNGCASYVSGDTVTAISQEIWAEGANRDRPLPREYRKNYYEPIMTASNQNMIRLKYLSVGPNARHRQAIQ